MPKYVTIDEIESGMIVSEAIVNNFGQTLVPAGTKLTENQKKVLKTWNVPGLMIKSDFNEEAMLMHPELRSIARNRILKRMNWRPKNEMETDILEMAIVKLIIMTTIN
ncbi:MAG: hypothetical protein NTW25_11950 [Candidatus Kapabacteria bacterium]|jgi:hypothetical protein|nr:hypothetical protein [Candidatus Kapabacteria bacterium]